MSILIIISVGVYSSKRRALINSLLEWQLRVLLITSLLSFVAIVAVVECSLCVCRNVDVNTVMLLLFVDLFFEVRIDSVRDEFQLISVNECKLKLNKCSQW